MLLSSRGLGGSMPGEDVLRSSRALNKGLRETEVPKEITDTVSNLDAFIKEQQITQAKVSAFCQVSASIEESSEFSKIQHLVDIAPEGKELLEKTAASLESINGALRDMQVNVNLVWQKAQLSGLPLATSSGPLPVGKGLNVGAPKLTSYFEATMRRLEEQVLFQQRRLEEMMSALSSSQDPASLSSSLPDVILNLNQTIICLAAKIAERHETVARLQQKFLNTGSSENDDFGGILSRFSTTKTNNQSVGINPFQLAVGSNLSSGISRSSAQTGICSSLTPSLGRPVGLGNSSFLPLQPSQPTANTSAAPGLGGGIRLNTPSSLFGPTSTGFGAGSATANTPAPAVRPWSSDTTNNRFSTSFTGAGGQLDAGKRSRAL